MAREPDPDFSVEETSHNVILILDIRHLTDEINCLHSQKSHLRNLDAAGEFPPQPHEEVWSTRRLHLQLPDAGVRMNGDLGALVPKWNGVSKVLEIAKSFQRTNFSFAAKNKKKANHNRTSSKFEWYSPNSLHNKVAGSLRSRSLRSK